MRIIHVMLSKNFSGTERHVIELTEAQAGEHEVHVILHAKGFGNRANAIGHRFAKQVQVHKVGKPIRQWTFSNVRQLINELQPDVVHCHLKAAAKAVKGLSHSIPKVATLHIDYDPSQHDHMGALIAITPHQQQRVNGQIHENTVQIDNWVSGQAASHADALALRRAYGIDDDCILIGTIGRVEQSKQHALLIEAAKPLLGSNVKLAVIGTGRLLNELKAAHPEVIMPGYSDQPKTWMRAFDVFVSAADYEPFGLVFLEALQAQTPVVATATEGAQYLAGALNITPVPIHNVAALRDAIQQALSSAPARADVTCEAFELPEKSQQVLDLYAQMIKKAG